MGLASRSPKLSAIGTRPVDSNGATEFGLAGSVLALPLDRCDKVETVELAIFGVLRPRISTQDKEYSCIPQNCEIDSANDRVLTPKWLS